MAGWYVRLQTPTMYSFFGYSGISQVLKYTLYVQYTKKVTPYRAHSAPIYARCDPPGISRGTRCSVCVYSVYVASDMLIIKLRTFRHSLCCEGMFCSHTHTHTLPLSLSVHASQSSIRFQLPWYLSRTCRLNSFAFSYVVKSYELQAVISIERRRTVFVQYITQRTYTQYGYYSPSNKVAIVTTLAISPFRFWIGNLGRFKMEKPLHCGNRYAG